MPVLFTQSTIGAVLSEKVCFTRFRLSQFCVFLALAALLPAVVFHSRSLVWPKYLQQNETDSMFFWAPQLKTELTEAARFALKRHDLTVGIDARLQEGTKGNLSLDPFEYLIMRPLTLPHRFLQPQTEPFDVDNLSAKLWQDQYRPPDCVILYSRPAQETVIDRQTGRVYRAAKKWEHVAFLLPHESPLE